MARSLKLVLIVALFAPQILWGQANSFSQPSNSFNTQQRFIDGFIIESSSNNLDNFVSLHSRSIYEFNRNIQWLKSEHKDGKDPAFMNAYANFLWELIDRLTYFPEDALLLVRMIEIFDTAALPISNEISYYMVTSWQQRRLQEADNQKFVKIIITLLSWHYSVDSHYQNKKWKSIAADLANSENCLQIRSCKARVAFLLRSKDH